jgi:hypothetical protein
MPKIANMPSFISLFCLSARLKFNFLSSASELELTDQEFALIDEDVLSDVIALKKDQPGFAIL